VPIVEELSGRLELLRGLTQDDVVPEFTPEAVAAFSAFAAPMDGYVPPEVEVTEHAADGPHGAVPMRVYEPDASERSGAGIVWLHGGGFAGGDLDMGEADGVARELVARAGITVVSVDYRLVSPGVHFPVPHDDVVAAWRWAHTRVDRLDVQPGRLALGGASAGANLATGVALRLRDEGRPLPSALVLAYPALAAEIAAGDGLPADMASVPKVLRFPPPVYAAVLGNYLGGAAATPYSAPALGALAGLPPITILAAEYDDLRPSAEAFAAAARVAGVPVTVRCEAGMPHGHLNIPGLHAAEPSLRFLIDAVRG
jgi:acetyl esterase/lipase